MDSATSSQLASHMLIIVEKVNERTYKNSKIILLINIGSFFDSLVLAIIQLVLPSLLLSVRPFMCSLLQ